MQYDCAGRVSGSLTAASYSMTVYTTGTSYYDLGSSIYEAISNQVSSSGHVPVLRMPMRMYMLLLAWRDWQEFRESHQAQ